MKSKSLFISPFLTLLTLTLCLSTCAQEKEVKLNELGRIDSLNNLALNISKTDKQYTESLLKRNEYAWKLKKITQLESDIPEILSQHQYAHEMGYSKVFNPQRSDPMYWESYIETCTELLTRFKKGTPAYREILGLKSQLLIITGNNKLGLEVLSELLDELNNTADMYYYMLWQYGMSQVRLGDEVSAILSFEKGYKAGVEIPNHSEFAMALMNLYSIHKKYDSIIEEKPYILKDTSGSLMYFLGEAYFKTDNRKLATLYFDSYMSHFKETERQPFLIIESGYAIHSVRPKHLLVLAEFYSKLDSEKSCKCYYYIQKIVSQPEDNFFYQKQLAAITDETEKSEFKKTNEAYQNDLNELLIKANNQLKSCK